MNSNTYSAQTLSIIIPAFNEEHTLRDVINSISLDFPHEIILVDDGSSDNTFEIAKVNPHVRAIRHILNRGYGAAVATGFEIAKGDIIVTIDADGQNDPQQISELIQPILSGDADIVVGSRYLDESNGLRVSLIKRIGEKLIGFVLQKRYGVKITNSQSGFKTIRKEVIKSLLPLTEERFGFNTELLVYALKNGFRVVELPKKEVPRKYGKSKIKLFSDGFRILYALIKSILG